MEIPIMSSLSSTAQGFERMLELSRNLTRGVDAGRTGSAPRRAQVAGLSARLAAFGERWALARAAEAWQELARHDHRMAQELRAALLRDR
jgi:hypothetical protein